MSVASIGSDYEEGVRRQRVALLSMVEGPIAEGLAQPDVSDVMVNPDGSVWLDRIFGTIERVYPNLRPGRVEAIISSIAGLLGGDVEGQRLEGELALDGSRVQGLLPPASIGGPTLAIRKRRPQGVDGWPALSLADYDMPPVFGATLEMIVSERLNLLIVGSTGSGKTTFGGAFLRFISECCPEDRIITVEDTHELTCSSKCVVQWRATDKVSQRELVRAAMRSRPDRLILGEVRDAAACDMIMALGTGHPGFSTVHGGSLDQGLRRVRQLTRVGGDDPVSAEDVADAIHYVAMMRREPRGPRRLVDMAKVVGWKDGRFQLEHITAQEGDS